MTRENRAAVQAVAYTFLAFFIAIQRDIDNAALIDHYLTLRIIVIASCAIVIVSLHTLFVRWFDARD